MMRRDWSLFKYELADFLFGKQLDEAYSEGMREGAQFASRKLSMAVRNLEASQMTKTQRIGHQKSMEAIYEAKKEVMRKTGAQL